MQKCLRRKKLPARVNCWFCNSNIWVPYASRNRWICPKCDQYNGFTQDGDYNAPIDTRTPREVSYSRESRPSPTDIGFRLTLCRRCNSDQRMKVAQLAEFVPMSDSDFDREVDAFKNHLEKVYKLCNRCRRVLKFKLSSEKGLHLNTKLLKVRAQSSEEESTALETLDSVLGIILKVVILTLATLVVLDMAININLFLSKSVLYSTKRYFREIYRNVTTFISPYYSSVVSVYPFDDLTSDMNLVQFTADSVTAASADLKRLIEDFVPRKLQDVSSWTSALCLVGLFSQILVHLCNLKSSYRHVFNDIMWGIMLYNARMEMKNLYILQIIIVSILYVTTFPLNRSGSVKGKETIRNAKKPNVGNNFMEELDRDSDSDDDINEPIPDLDSGRRYDTASSCSKYANPFYHRGGDVKNSPFIERPGFKSNIIHGTSSSASSIFNFNSKRYDQLDKSIRDLNLGFKKKSDNYPRAFSMKNYECSSPNIFGRSSTASSERFVVSPSRFTHGTRSSWVAGGYWGADNSTSAYDPREVSSSSSQSSGFESLPPLFRPDGRTSLPSSRDGSVCGDRERTFRPADFCISNSPPGFRPLRSPTVLDLKADELAMFPNVQMNKSGPPIGFL